MARNVLFSSIRAAAIGALMALATFPAQAQVVCGGRHDIVMLLAQAFQEKQVGYGLVSKATVVEIYVSQGGSWTMLVTDVTGRSCILAAGEGWETTPAVTARAGSL